MRKTVCNLFVNIKKIMLVRAKDKQKCWNVYNGYTMINMMHYTDYIKCGLCILLYIGKIEICI